MIDHSKLQRIRDPQAWAVGAKNIREPLAWAVLALVAANLVLGLVRLVLLLTLDKVPVFAAFQEIGLSLMPLSLVLALVALVCACLFLAPSTPRAYLLIRVAAWVLTVGVGLAVVCMLLGVAASANAFTVVLEIFGGLLDVIIKALAAGSLWVILRGVGAGRIDTAPSAEADQQVQEEPPTIEPVVPTVWSRDSASGAVWRTADEAASGHPGLSAFSEGAAPSPPPVTPDGGAPGGWRPVDRAVGTGDASAQGLTNRE